MKIGKRVTELQRIYSIPPEDVYFSMLVGLGATMQEAFAAIYRPTAASPLYISQLARQKRASTPGISQLIEAVESGRLNAAVDSRSLKTAAIVEQRRSKAAPTNAEIYRTKDGIIDGLIKSLETANTRERADILMKIADLQRMKQEENKEDPETVHYYLPLSCQRCELWRRERNQERQGGAE